MNVEFRAVVHYYWLLGKGPTEIHDQMVQAYNGAAPTLSFVKKWIVMFKNGRTELNDLPRSGRPINEDYIDKVKQYIEDYPFSSAQSISSAIGIHAYTVIKILTVDLGRKKRHAKWVPHVLTDCQIKNRRQECYSLYSILKGLSKTKQYQVITCDESWFYLNYYTEEAYLHEGENIVLPNRLISDQKIMIFSAFSASGLVLLEMLPLKTRFNSQYMCDVILPSLREAAQTKLGIRKNSNVLIHLDNAKPHNSKKTNEKFKELKFTRLPHPAYSPDVSPNDFFLYGFSKNKLKGKVHNSANELFQSLTEIIENIDKSTWEAVFQNWINRLHLVFLSGGAYL